MCGLTMNQEMREAHIIQAFKETDHPDLTHREVADALDIHYTTARRHIKRLESKGALRHTRSNGNTKMYDIAP